jgi:signal transduction histidine kinase/DNA-binding response OmpR family regulator/ligand-binding sensor domain-containing protein
MTWIGTQNGLNRFDGYGFKHYLGKNHGVDLRDIYRIGQDDEGWLWLGQGTSFIFFNPKTEVFKTLEERFGKDCVLAKGFKKHIYFSEFMKDIKGRIYFVRNRTSEIYSYHSSEGFKKIDLPLDINRIYLKEITADYEFIFQERIRADSLIMYNWTINSATLDTLDKEWWHLDYLTRKNYKTNLIWQISDRKICEVFDETEKLLVSIDPLLPYISAFYFDNQNKTWLLTPFGFCIINIQKSKFEFIKTPISNSLGQSIRGLSVNANKMKAAIETGGIGTYDFQQKKWLRQDTYGLKRAIYEIDDNHFWVGSSSGLSLSENEKTKNYPIFRTVNGKEDRAHVWSIFPEKESATGLWLGTDEGLFYFDILSKKYRFIENKLTKNKSDVSFVQTIVRDKYQPNWLWLNTANGLMLFDENKEEYLAVFHLDQPAKNFLPAENFQDLYQESKAIYWLATADNGVIRWDRMNHTFQQFTTKDGLPSNVIYAIYPDNFGRLWMSSDYGISRMNKETKAVQNFLLPHGIGQTEFNRISHDEFRDKNGVQRLAFGGLEGVTLFYPKDFQQAKQVVKPFLRLINYQYYDGKDQIIKDNTVHLRKTNTITLRPNDYIHSFEVSLLNYEDVDANQYTYQLQLHGQKANWTSQKSRNIILGQLPYGTHQLIIKATTVTNLKSANELTFEIVVIRPLLLRWWFILLAVLTIIASIFYWYNWRTRQLKERQIELEDLVEERTEKVEKQSAELREIDHLKSRFFANIAHELKTPITLIQGPIQSTLNRQKLTNQDFTLLTKAKQNTGKLSELVDEIFDLTKLDAHKLVLEESNIPFYPFVRAIIGNFESIADIQSTELVFIYDASESLQLKIDKRKLEKILNNLLSNAFKFTPEKGKIIVHIQDRGNLIEMSVKDNGRGILTADLPNVFNRFFQSSTDKKPEGGLGIGLTLSMEFVKLMNGEIWVESSSDKAETGSTFYVQFPKKEVIQMMPTETQIIIDYENKVVERPLLFPENTSNTIKNETILIVEDNHDLRDFLTYILSPYYNILTAKNGLDALHQLGMRNEELEINQNPEIPHSSFPIPNLILSDVMMPIMDGFEFLERVKANEQWRGLPFIMLTARAEMQTRLNALRIGVDAYLLKPFDEDELLARVKNLLANYNARKTYLQEVQAENPDEIIISNEVISAADQKWLEDLEHLIMKEMGKSIFSNDYLADLLSISRNILYAKIKQLTGLTPTKYVRLIRLQKAKTLLEQGRSVKEVSYEVGFQKPEYFSKIYKKEFGKFPSE